jgi:hypothetical protein
MTGKPIRPIMKKLVGMVTLGALVIAGTALHFAPGPTGESSSPSSSEKTIADSRFTDIDAVDDYLSVDDLLKHVYTEEPDQGTMASPSSTGTAQEIQVLPEDDPYAYLTREEFDQVLTDKNARHLEQQRVSDSIEERLEVQRVQKGMLEHAITAPTIEQQRAADSLEERLEVQRLLQEEFAHQMKKVNDGNSLIERLERQIDNLLAEAARNPSRNTPQLNREIERLDNEIDMLRLNAMQNQPAGRPKQNMFDWGK